MSIDTRGASARSRPLATLGATRQLERASHPGPGKPLAFRLRGPADTPWRLFAALRTGRRVTDLGLLLLDPASAELVTRGTLDGEGKAEASVRLPADPGLLGVDVLWQATVGAPPRFTNLERTTLTAF